jgi:hypothetical protein
MLATPRGHFRPDGEAIVADETGKPQFYDRVWQRASAASARHSAEGIADRFRGAIRRGQGASSSS